MSSNTMIVEAVYENGVFRPVETIALDDNQRVTLIITSPRNDQQWPDDVAEIYKEAEAEDRALAKSMLPTVGETWPKVEDDA